jgi:hypothetical protein
MPAVVRPVAHNRADNGAVLVAKEAFRAGIGQHDAVSARGINRVFDHEPLHQRHLTVVELPRTL